MPPRTSKARARTPRTLTLTSAPSALRFKPATTRISGEARGWPSAPRATRGSTAIRLAFARLMPEVSSDCEPFWTTMALSARPVARSARRKPLDIDIRNTNTVTTSATPPTASSVTCQRERRLRTL